MITRYSITFILLILSACTPISDDTTLPDKTDSGIWIGTGVMTQTGRDIVGTGTLDYQYPLEENLTGSGDAYYPIFDELETKTIPIKHRTGVETKIAFINSEANSMHVSITFPETETDGNLRLAQIVMPDGQMDGPFGIDTTIELTQLGGYELLFRENMMSGDPWTGDAIITVSLSKK